MERLPGKTIGIHCHNNQQLAFANTISAIISGINYLDASLYGIGRGAGNCPLELLIAFLKNPKFKVRPLIEAIEAEILPWQEKIDWGYYIPYMITGVLNQHPRTAMAHMESDKRIKSHNSLIRWPIPPSWNRKMLGNLRPLRLFGADFLQDFNYLVFLKRFQDIMIGPCFQAFFYPVH